MNVVLTMNFASTWAMVGLIWLIQVVHYPLFAQVGDDNFSSYADAHQRLITYIVLPLMFAELGTSLWLWTAKPPQVSASLVAVGIALVIVIWTSTFLLQVPQHGKLLAGFDAEFHRQLVNGNWIRTIAWTLRGILVAYMAWCVRVAS